MRGAGLHISYVLLPSRTESGLLVDQAELERLAVLILVKGVTATTAAANVDGKLRVLAQVIFSDVYIVQRGVNSYYAEVFRVDPRIVHRTLRRVGAWAAEVEAVADCQAFGEHCLAGTGTGTTGTVYSS